MCPLCKKEEEDVCHFISSCRSLKTQRTSFIHKSNLELPTLEIPDNLDREDPLAFTKLILLPNPDLAHTTSNHFTALTLNFILQIHTLRASVPQD